MKSTLLIGLGPWLLPLPGMIWKKRVNQAKHTMPARLAFMSEDHHRVRNYVVRELPRIGMPITPARLSEDLDMPAERVTVILDELERHLTFLYRNPAGDVAWAYPVTADETPHRITINGKERLYAA
jgi:hypothetical protein